MWYHIIWFSKTHALLRTDRIGPDGPMECVLVCLFVCLYVQIQIKNKLLQLHQIVRCAGKPKPQFTACLSTHDHPTPSPPRASKAIPPRGRKLADNSHQCRDSNRTQHEHRTMTAPRRLNNIPILGAQSACPGDHKANLVCKHRPKVYSNRPSLRIDR